MNYILICIDNQCFICLLKYHPSTTLTPTIASSETRFRAVVKFYGGIDPVPTVFDCKVRCQKHLAKVGLVRMVTYIRVIIPSNILDIKDRLQFRQWLIEHYATERECRVVAKRGKTPPEDALWYVDAVEEALCFGH